MKIPRHYIGCISILTLSLTTGFLAKVGSARLGRERITPPGSTVAMPQFPGETFVDLWAREPVGLGLGCVPTRTTWS